MNASVALHSHDRLRCEACAHTNADSQGSLRRG